MKRLLLLVPLLGAWVAPVRAQRPDDLQAVIRRLDAQLAADVAADSVGSISVALVDDGRVLWANAYGWAERDRRIAADTSHLYRIGSITKSVTAVALMRLVEEGVIGLDEPVERAFPPIDGLADRPAAAADLTYRHLASHTSGLIREPRLEGAAAGPIAGWEDRILASIPTTAYATSPGERYAYSNIGFGILGLAVSRAAGRPYMELVREGILSRLGMASSTFILDEPLRARLATGYAQRDGTVSGAQPEREHAGRGYKVPNGGLYSTVGDLARFIGGMTGAAPSAVLGVASRQEMFRVQKPEEDGSGYGLGFSIQIDSMGRRLVGHGGSVAGYTAYLLFEPGSGLGVILLRNYDRGATNLGRTARSALDDLLEAGAGAVRRPDSETRSAGESDAAREDLGCVRHAGGGGHLDEPGEVALEHHGPVPCTEDQHRGRCLAADDLVALLEAELAAEISEDAEQDGADADVLVRLDLGETARLLVRGEADHVASAGRASRWRVSVAPPTDDRTTPRPAPVGFGLVFRSGRS